MQHEQITNARQRQRPRVEQLGSVQSVTQDEERAAYAHGELCRAFMVRAQEAGIYE